jgi:hypothetical protein
MFGSELFKMGPCPASQSRILLDRYFADFLYQVIIERKCDIREPIIRAPLSRARWLLGMGVHFSRLCRKSLFLKRSRRAGTFSVGEQFCRLFRRRTPQANQETARSTIRSCLKEKSRPRAGFQVKKEKLSVRRHILRRFRITILDRPIRRQPRVANLIQQRSIADA